MQQEYAEGRNPSVEQLEILVYGVDDPTNVEPEIPESLKATFPHLTKALGDLYT